MNKLHILLVDDDMALLQALPHMITLRIHGVTVHTADSAQHALEQIQVNDYDAIVSDIKMPGMDGLELLGKIHELRPEIPTLLITGHADQALITQAIRGGAYDFIQKPIDRVYFGAALHRALQTRQLRRQVEEQQRALELHAKSLEQLVERRTRELLAANEAMEALVRDVLDVSLIESTKLVLHPTPCNLVELCQHVLDAYTAGAGLALSFEVAAKSIEVEVDRDRMSQVLMTLLFHARKYTPKGSPITITLQQVEDKAIITVRDMGLTEESIPRFFEQFSHAPEDESTAKKHSSAGLGLSLSQQIVERHGGSIEIQNTLETGRVLSVVLPLFTRIPTKHASNTTTEEHEAALFQPPQWLIS